MLLENPSDGGPQYLWSVLPPVIPAVASMLFLFAKNGTSWLRDRLNE
jgi:hypothetical protein